MVGSSVVCKMWKVTAYGFLFVLLHTAKAGPCCKDNDNMYSPEDDIQIKCVSTDEPIELYKMCNNFFSADSSFPTESTFQEDESRNQYTFDNISWYNNYCTGVLVNKSDPAVKASHIFICFDEDYQQQKYSKTYFIYAICQIISIIFLICTLVVYIMLPELRDLQGKCVICFTISLTIGYSSLSYLQITSSFVALKECVTFAFLTYFWLLSAFFWLNINSFNVWRSTVLGHINYQEKRLFACYIIAGWGIPLIFLTVAIITHNMPGDIIKPNFGQDRCWFQGNVELWSFFYGPVAILLICNILYFLSTALHLWSDYRSPQPINRIKSLRVKFGLYLKLFLTMGITWIFEIFSFVAGDHFIWNIMDILNCLQGIIIFVVMIATRRRVWRALARKKPCGLACNEHWETMEVDETEDALIDNNDQQLHDGKA